MKSAPLRPGRDRRSHWHPKPHHQIIIVSVVSLAALAVVALSMVVRLDQVHSSYRLLAGRELPITDSLTRAELRYQADMAEAAQLLGPMTEAQRGAAITDLTEKTRVADAEWTSYKRLAVGFRGETDLQAVAEKAEKAQVEIITPALSGKPLPAGTAERLARAGAQQINAIEALRSRYASTRTTAATAVSTAVDRARRDLEITGGVELALLLLLFGTVYTSVWRRDRQVRSIELATTTAAGRNDLETRLTRSLEMVHDESSVYPRLERALAEVAAGHSGEVLLASSSHSRLRQVVALGAAATPVGGCQVASPGDCPAIARAQTLVFPHSGALDACPYLDGRPEGPCSAACVPLSIGGKTTGVVHVTAPPDHAPDSEIVARLVILARKAGDRIGMLRAFSRSEAEAHTDQLTGLLNRRSLEDAVHRIIESGQAYTVAYGDLDHFKQVNDVYGHDAGDRALRVFSRVLRDSVRPNDVPARYGGEEFVVILPECAVADATQVLERVRENLARAQATASAPAFTVSFGLASSDSGRDFDAVLKVADRALAAAKEQGRDCIVAAPAPSAIA